MFRRWEPERKNLKGWWRTLVGQTIDLLTERYVGKIKKKCDRGMEVYNQRRREDKRAAAPVRREERSGRQSRFRGVGRWRRR